MRKKSTAILGIVTIALLLMVSVPVQAENPIPLIGYQGNHATGKTTAITNDDGKGITTTNLILINQEGWIYNQPFTNEVTPNVDPGWDACCPLIKSKNIVVPGTFRIHSIGYTAHIVRLNDGENHVIELRGTQVVKYVNMDPIIEKDGIVFDDPWSEENPPISHDMYRCWKNPPFDWLKIEGTIYVDDIEKRDVYRIFFGCWGNGIGIKNMGMDTSPSGNIIYIINDYPVSRVQYELATQAISQETIILKML